MNSKINISSNLLFYLGYILMSVGYYFSNVIIFSNHVNTFRLISSFLFLILCLIQSKKYNKNTLLIIFALIALNVIIYLKCDNILLLQLILVIFASRNIDIEKIVKFDIILKIMIMISVFCFYKAGYTNNILYYRDSILRYSFGFAHPNTFDGILTNIIIEILYIFRNKKNIFLVLFLLFVSFFLNSFTGSRTSLVLTVIISFFYIFNGDNLYKILSNRVVKILINNSWLLMAILSLFLGILYTYNFPISIYLDNIFETRLRWISRFLNMYNINLLGNKMTFVTDQQASILHLQRAILDNAYVRFLLQYGLIMFFVMNNIIKKIFCFAYKNKNSLLIIVLLIYVLKGFSEHGIFRIYNNVFILFYSYVFYKNRGGLKNEKEN